MFRALRFLPAAVAACVFSAALFAPAAFAQDKENGEKKVTEKEILDLIDEMGNEDQKASDVARAKLIEIGKPAVPHLVGEVIEGESMIVRGWCVVALSEIGGEDVMKRLTEIQNDTKQPMLVRTWAAAAQVYQAESTAELLKLAPLINQFPALGRPIGMRLIDKLADQGKPASAEQMIEISMQVPQLNQALAPAILNLGVEKLTDVMLNAKNVNTARQATAYLGTLANQSKENKDEVAKAVYKDYKFDAKAKKVPWGGALWIPMIQWEKENADELVESLIAWYVWADVNLDGQKARAAQTQVHNNIRGVGFSRVLGYQVTNFQFMSAQQWLQSWGKAAGKERATKLLETVGDEAVEKFGGLVDKL